MYTSSYVGAGQSSYPGGIDMSEEEYSQRYGDGGQVATQGAPPVNTLMDSARAYGINTSGSSGGGAPSQAGGNTQVVKLSDGRQVLVDLDDGRVISQYGDAEPSKFGQERQLQQERFAHEDAQSERKYQQGRELRDTDPANDPWRQMMPKYVSPSAIQGDRGALDIMDPNTGQLTNVRQPGAPPVRVESGNLVVEPGANAAVYYDGNKGQATNVSGGPQMLYGNASFPGAMGQAEQIAGRLQGGRQGGGSAGGGGGYGGSSGGGSGAGNTFSNPGGAASALGQFRNLDPYTAPGAGNRFANPSQPIDAGPGGYTGEMYGDEGLTPESFLGPSPGPWTQSEPLDPFGPDMDYQFGYYA